MGKGAGGNIIRRKYRRGGRGNSISGKKGTAWTNPEDNQRILLARTGLSQKSRSVSTSFSGRLQGRGENPR